MCHDDLGEESAFSCAGNEDECRHWKQGDDGAEIIVAKSDGVRSRSEKFPRPFPAIFFLNALPIIGNN